MENNFEAWDMNFGFCIYNGPHQRTLINVVKHYISVAQHINDSYIDAMDNETLDVVALKYVGIEVYSQHINGGSIYDEP